jgi:hypothetical protein
MPWVLLLDAAHPGVKAQSPAGLSNAQTAALAGEVDCGVVECVH